MDEKNQCSTPSTYAERPINRSEILAELFTYHAPNQEQEKQYRAIRAAAKYFAEVLLENTPRSADQSVAIRKLRETVMTANAAIANNGLSL